MSSSHRVSMVRAVWQPRPARRAVAAVAWVVLSLLWWALAGCDQRTSRRPAADPLAIASTNLLQDCPDLRAGDQGRCVDELQRLLTVRGGHSFTIGVADVVTAALVVEFQRARGLAPTGIVDIETKQALYDRPDDSVRWDLRTECVDLSVGAAGACVDSLRHLLSGGSGARPQVPNEFDSAVRDQVARLQTAVGVTPNGVVGVLTKQALYQRFFADLPSVVLSDVTGTARCQPGSADCDVYFSRTTTADIGLWLDRHGAVLAALGVLLGDAACRIARRETRWSTCGPGANLIGRYVLGQLSDARGRNWCVRVRLLAPSGYRTALPVGVYADNSDTHCVDEGRRWSDP